MPGLKSLFFKIIRHQLLSASLIMVIGTNAYNFSQLIFHFLTGRFLGNKALYGDLASIISLVGIITIVQVAVGLTIVKLVASEKDNNKVAGFVKWLDRTAIFVGIVIFLMTFLISPFLSTFLNLVEPKAAFFLGPIVGLFLVVSTERSVLQGLLDFKKYVYSILVEASGKIVVTTVLLFLGFSIFGALTAYLAGVLIATLVTRRFLSKYLQSHSQLVPDLDKFFKYSLATLVQGLSLTAMYTMDLLLVKHFFSAEIAGTYASLSILGRIVFFGTTPISSVMFPIVAKRHLNNQKYLSILFLSLILVIFISAILITFYYFFPALPITLLYGKEYLEGAGLLWWFGLFMGLLSVAMLLTQFQLSIGKTSVIYLFVVAAALQTLLIWFIHPNVLTVIQLSLISTALLVISLFIYLVLTMNRQKIS